MLRRRWYILSAFLILILGAGFFLGLADHHSFSWIDLLRYIIGLTGLIMIGAIIYFRVQPKPTPRRTAISTRFRIITPGSDLHQQTRAFCIPRKSDLPRPPQESLFGTAGIRGLTNIQITPLLALKIGQVFSDYLGNQGTVAMGYDTRYGSRMLSQAISSGLMSGGINVLDCGCIPTGGVACAVVKKHLAGGIMITGSHTPYEMNGLIIMQSDGTYLSNEVARELEQRFSHYENRQVVVNPEQIGQYQLAEHPLEIYQEFLLSLINQELVRSKHYKVLVDPCNGTAGLVLPPLLKTLGCELVLNNESLCPIPNRPTEPRATNLGPIASKIKEHYCHLGIATDMDADRVLFIDETGRVLSEDLIGALFARSIFEADASKKICVTPINSSGLIEKVCRELGRELISCPIGAPQTLQVIKECQASFAYEESGKYYFADEVLWADGILAVLKLLQIMAQKGKSLTELAAEFPAFYQVKHSLPCPEHLKDKIMERVRSIWEKEALNDRLKDITFDGLKRSYEDGAWLLIRRSGTEPLIRVYADAPSAGRAEELVLLGKGMVQRALKKN